MAKSTSGITGGPVAEVVRLLFSLTLIRSTRVRYSTLLGVHLGKKNNLQFMHHQSVHKNSISQSPAVDPAAFLIQLFKNASISPLVLPTVHHERA